MTTLSKEEMYDACCKRLSVLKKRKSEALCVTRACILQGHFNEYWKTLPELVWKWVNEWIELIRRGGARNGLEKKLCIHILNLIHQR